MKALSPGPNRAGRGVRGRAGLGHGPWEPWLRGPLRPPFVIMFCTFSYAGLGREGPGPLGLLMLFFLGRGGLTFLLSAETTSHP